MRQFAAATWLVLALGCGSSDAPTSPSAAAGGASAASAGASGTAGRAGAGGVPSAGGSAGNATGGGGQGVGGAAGAAGASKPTTTIRVHYPGAKQLTLRGDHGELSWTTGVALTKGSNDTWTFTSTAIDAPTEVKPLVDDTKWSKGPNFKIKPGTSVDVYPRFDADQGKLELLDAAFKSTQLPDTRAVWAYLPPTYVENAAFVAPVVYMHDGQNAFGQPGAFGDWQTQATVDAGALSGAIDEAIVIGIANTPARLDEYTPTFDATEGFGGKGDAYLSMIVDELKPRVDATYRTHAGRESTALLGSSLGGLISAYGGVKRAETFGIIGVMSPSTWWDGLMLVDLVGQPPTKKSLRVYVDSGDAGPSNDGVSDTKLLAAAYAKVGYVEGQSLRYVVDPGGQHNEAAWAKRLPGALSFLLGPRADLR